MEGWQKLLVAAGSAAGVGAVLYYLLREDPEADEKLLAAAAAGQDPSGAGGARAHAPSTQGGSKDISSDELLVILKEMNEGQQQMKAIMKTLSKELADDNLQFDQLYKKVAASQPADPLEKRGLSMADLEAPLERNQQNPQVMEAMQNLMAPATMSAPSAKVPDISVEKITEINIFMLEQLQEFIKTFHGLANKASYDMKTVVTASQALLDSKVSAKFNIQSEDMESAIMANQAKLCQNQRFLQAHMTMQQTMEQFINSM